MLFNQVPASAPPSRGGLAAAWAATDRRLATMIVRTVGATRLGAPTVADPTCANRESVVSVDDLDQMRPVLYDM